LAKEFFNKPRAVYLSEAGPDPFERLEAKLKRTKDQSQRPAASGKSLERYSLNQLMGRPSRGKTL
jgi:hypothetical protein